MILDGSEESGGKAERLLLLAPKYTIAIVMANMTMAIIAMPIVSGVDPAREKPLGRSAVALKSNGQGENGVIWLTALHSAFPTQPLSSRSRDGYVTPQSYAQFFCNSDDVGILAMPEQLEQ